MLQFALYASIKCMQLRRKLFLVLSMMAMLPLLFLLFGVIERVERDLQSRTASELHKTLAKMGQEILALMDTQRSLAEGVAKVPLVQEFGEALQSGDAELIEQKMNQLAVFFLNYQSTVPSIQAIRFTDVRGHTMVKVKEGHLLPAKLQNTSGNSFIEDIAYKPFFQHAIKTNKNVIVSDFERGKVAGEVDFCPAMVRYTVPIRDQVDTLEGLLTINMWGRRVDDTVQAALGGYPGKAYIAEINTDAERDGIYLYHENPDWRFANQLGTGYRLSSELGTAVWKQIKESGTHGMVRGSDNRLFYYRKLSLYDDRATQWLLMIETDTATVLAPVAALRHWIGYLLAGALILSILGARWAASRLARPVHDLAQIITRYADGDRQVRYLANRTDEIGSAGRAFNYLSDSLERANRDRERAEQAAHQSERLAAIGQLAAGIGHEINNPLMNIMSLANLVEGALPEGEQQAKNDLRALQSEGRRCARIVQGILNFARENQPRYQRFDFSQLIDDTVALFQHRIKASDLHVHVNVSHALFMEGDANQLQQVLVNVLLNAIQASPRNSSIGINAELADGMVRFELLDEGSGLSSHAEANVFNPFFTTKPEGTGTGLGLSVSYGIVKKHGGRITLENRAGGGVRVVIILPAVVPAKIAPTAGAALQALEKSGVG